MRYAGLIEHANKLTLRSPNLHVLNRSLTETHHALALCLQECVLLAERERTLILPDLSAYGSDGVATFSDYAGESSKYHDVYSFLICSHFLNEPFNERMANIRAKFGIGTREIAYKHLKKNDLKLGGMDRCIPDYLAALDSFIPGLLFTVLVDKKVKSLFGAWGAEGEKVVFDILKSHNFGDRRPKVAENLLRIVHTTAFLNGLLAHNGQKLFWMSDHDQIVPTPEFLTKNLTLLSHVLPLYAEKKTFSLVSGAIPFAERSTSFLDLLSAADLAAGSLLALADDPNPIDSGMLELKEGARHVLRWLGRAGLGLKKMSVYITLNESGGICCGNIDLRALSDDSASTVVPLFIDPQ